MLRNLPRPLPNVVAVSENALLQETGDTLLLETGESILLDT